MKVMLFAYLDNNIGDDLMLKLISERFPDFKFYFYTSNTVVKNTLNQFKNFISRDPADRNNDLVFVDGILSIGGSIFNDLNNIRGKLSRIKKILFLNKAKKQGKKIITLGCNLGPYSDQLGVFLTLFELRMNSLVTVRDKASYDLINSNRKLNNLHLADDIVYNLNFTSCLDIKSGLGISAFRSTHKGENNYQNYQALAKIADEYIKKNNKIVRIFAFDSEAENDLSAAHHIFELIDNKNMVKIIPYIGNFDNFLSEFGGCECHIAIRFHSAILSDIFKIPFYPVAYSNKMKEFICDKFPDFDLINISSLQLDKFDFFSVVENLSNLTSLCSSTRCDNNSKIHFDELEILWK